MAITMSKTYQKLQKNKIKHLKSHVFIFTRHTLPTGYNKFKFEIYIKKFE